VRTFGPKRGATKFGINVKFTDGKWRKFWYGQNRDLRDRRHNQYHSRHDVLVVQDIQE